VPQLAIRASLTPSRGMVAPCWSSMSAGHKVDPWSSTVWSATTRSTRACPVPDVHPHPWGAAGAETRMFCMIVQWSANTWIHAQLKTNITQLVYNEACKWRNRVIT
jgi:hypothetical protein